MNPPAVKHCPICDLDLPVESFGGCKARKDGRNLYCKSCIRKKVYAGRREQKDKEQELKRLIRRRIESQPEIGTVKGFKLPPVQVVLRSIRRYGPCTQAKIARETKVPIDEIGDALANLILETKEVRTRVIGNTRIYEINEVEEPKIVEREVPPWTQVISEAGNITARRVA